MAANTSEIQRLAKALESAGIKLGSVASSITGASATAMIAFFFAPGFFSPPKRRTSRLYRACSRPRTRIAFQAACTSIGLM